MKSTNFSGGRIPFLVVVFGLLISVTSCKDDASPKNEVTSDVEATIVDLRTPDELYPQLFVDVQMGEVFPDSKTFVDCTANLSAEKINSNYNSVKSNKDFDLTAFVNKHFTIPGSISSDFKSDPDRTAAEHVAALWPVLKRESDQVTGGSTLIPMPYPYIVPGGRFREVYYWDSYFTMLGLVESGEFVLIENMLDNFAFLIKTVGHIPNGNRKYYKTRSQPPFFSQMVKLYADEKGDEVYAKYQDALIGEYQFWMNSNGKVADANQHLVLTGSGMMNRYYDKGVTPRQESYREDYLQVEETGGGEKMYADLRAGAESGWDYSSRWFANGKDINTIETTDIIPVDLNALLYGLEEILLSKCKLDENMRMQISGQQSSRIDFQNTYALAEDGTFEDYNWVKEKRTGLKSLAMVYPLFFEMASQEQADAVAKSIEDDFLKSGGVVTTLVNTGQQWDAPNGWAPLQWMTVMGLDNYGHTDLAAEVASRWVTINEKVYKNTGKFVEKYNVEDMTLDAGGGEYPVQDGFGWSNGVYLALKAYLTPEGRK